MKNILMLDFFFWREVKKRKKVVYQTGLIFLNIERKKKKVRKKEERKPRGTKLFCMY
jgi:hypothetical protein